MTRERRVGGAGAPFPLATPPRAARSRPRPHRSPDAPPVASQAGTAPPADDVATYLEEALERWRGECVEIGDLRAGASLAGRVQHAVELLRGKR